MRFPTWLYKLLPGDEGTQQLGVIWRESSNTDAALDVSSTPFVVPTDKCLVLTNLTGNFLPAGNTVERRRFIADPPSGTTRYNILDEEANGGATQVMSLNWQGEVVIPGGWKVRAECRFNSVAGGTVNCEMHGYLIPRGTFIFG